MACSYQTGATEKVMTGPVVSALRMAVSLIFSVENQHIEMASSVQLLTEY